MSCSSAPRPNWESWELASLDRANRTFYFDRPQTSTSVLSLPVFLLHLPSLHPLLHFGELRMISSIPLVILPNMQVLERPLLVPSVAVSSAGAEVQS